MATTLTFLSRQDEEVLLGWCGGSRIYHFREGQILLRSHDHSLVQDLVEQGKLTEEKALTDVRNYIITRAIGLQVDKIDLKLQKDVQAGDYFLLSTDGVMQVLDNSQLTEIFGTFHKAEETGGQILDICRKNPADNDTAYIVRTG